MFFVNVHALFFCLLEWSHCIYIYICYIYYMYIYIYIWANYNELTTSSLEIIVSKGNHPQMALIQVSEIL